jgi:hypothetical protein
MNMLPNCPIILVYECGFLVCPCCVVRSNRLALKYGFFDQEFKVFDQDFRPWKSTGYQVEGGNGLLWGYNLFFNRKLRVRVLLEPLTDQAAFDATSASLRAAIDRIKWGPGSKRKRLNQVFERFHSMTEITRELISLDDDFDMIKQKHPDHNKLMRLLSR